ncbi:unnamed protein product [Polarella glacialis]|uniref:Charged multivesicular body protein 5 n=1 Tax=Polarella glacialis TaxID=89957 RepID=A0A813ITE2_POLGL|nr:unnamed protein product [Polarella glacialis]
MKRLFGTAKEVAPKGLAPSLSDASARIDTRVEGLDAKITKCDEDIRRYMGAQGRAGPQQKQLALQCMKRKKMYEQQRDQILGTQYNVDCLLGAQEQADLTVLTVEAMTAGHQDLKERYKQIGGAADIERLMDNMADLQDEISDINEAVSTSYVVPDGFDEASFEAEFSALEEELALERMAGVSSVSRPAYLPPVPSPSAAPPEAVAEALPEEVPSRG